MSKHIRHQIIRSILLSFAIASVAWAQPVLDATYAPGVNTSFIQNSATVTRAAVLPVATGANVNWSFTLSGSQLYSYAFYDDVFSLSPASPYYGATLFRNHGGNDSAFFTLSAGGLYYLGLSQGIAFRNYYRPGQLYLPYGLAFGQIRLDSAVFYDALTGSGVGRREVDSLEYAGYGSLALNGLTYTDVILLKETKGYYNGQWVHTGVDPYTHYRWHIQGAGNPILQIDVPAGSGAPFATYLSNVVAPVAVRTTRQLPLTASPNPGSHTLTLTETATGMVRVHAADGKHVELPCRAGSVDIGCLTPGIYMLELGGRQVRFVKQ